MTLTKEHILNKAKVSSLDEVQHLNFWGTKFVDVSIVGQLPNLETAALSVNSIKSLSSFSSCKKLKELFLRKNDIESLTELYYLKEIKSLQTLWLTDNPIASEKNYRLFVIALLPQITKLDELDIKEEERQEASKMFPNPESAVKPPASHSSGVASSDEKRPNVDQNDPQLRVIQAISALLPTLDAGHLDALSLKISEEKRLRKKSKK